MFIGRTDVEAETPIFWGTCCEELTHLKRPWCWERLRAGGEGDDRGWDGWMASLTRWTWVWVDSGSWWWTGRPDMLQSMGSQRVGHDWATELNWTEFRVRKTKILHYFFSLMCISTLTRIWFYEEFHSLNCIFLPLREPSLERKANKQSSSWLYDWDTQGAAGDLCFQRPFNVKIEHKLHRGNGI